MAEESGPASDQRLLLARALTALEDAERRAHAPVPIVGWACRLPAGIADPSALWAFLLAGEDAIGPPRRPGLEGDGGYLGDPFLFDPALFGLSDREASLIDPQQRLALTVAREALLDAQISAHSGAPRSGGVFVAASTYDFALELLLRSGEPEVERAMAIGASHAAIAGRISQCFGLRGPSYSADAACASGLVALDAAVHSLRRGEIELAVVVAVNVMLGAYLSRSFRSSGLASADGRCRAYSKDAAGYGRGEAAIALVLMPPGGRRERARVLGSKVLHSGPSALLGAPSGPAEEEVIRGALADAALAAERVSFVEGHATATPVGDVVELEVLGKVYAHGIKVASAKTAFGHTEAASGLLGVLKAGLQISASTVAPHLITSPLSPHVDWRALPLEVPRAPAPLSTGALGGVSAFGFTGTNAHVIIGPGGPAAPAVVRDGPALVLLSAPDRGHLRSAAAALAETLESPLGADFLGMTRTLALGRPSLSERLAIVAEGRADALRSLERFAAGELAPRCFSGRSSPTRRPVSATASREEMAQAWAEGAPVALESWWPAMPWVELPLPPSHERSIDLAAIGAPAVLEMIDVRPRSPAIDRPAAQDPPAECLEDLIRRVALILGAEPDPHAPLRELGLDSRHALELRAELEEELHATLPATLVLEHPTLASLARALDAIALGRPSPLAQRAIRRRRQAPVAIVGLGCRLPGGVDDPEAFWQLLLAGKDAVGPVGADRWDVERWFHVDPERPGTTTVRECALVEDVFGFDARFFGITPREAVAMDPQQRLLLEASWTALEHALIPPSSLAGSDTGVFVGISSTDYALRSADPRSLDGYSATGNAHSIAANRLSYSLDLRGPSLAVDTACSSSLVAIHLACQSLAAGECRAALAGGVNVIAAVEPSIAFSRAGMVAADGRSRTFDAAASGYGRGEGVGVVVLKLLSDAERDGDQILAVIRGSAVSQDGRSQGLTAPSLGAQVEVIEAALGRAGLPPEAIDVIETHGTGTPLGDPIEVEALARALGAEGPTIPLGAVKTNIGHLEAAAGVAGTLKLVLSLMHEQLPPNLHFHEPNPHLRLPERRFFVPTTPQPWPRAPRPRVAGQSAFGFGGTNAHLVLSEGPARSQPVLPAAALNPPLLLSAASASALSALALRYLKQLQADPGSLGVMAADAAHGRDALRHRAAIVAPTPEEALAALSALAQGRARPGLYLGEVPRRGPGRLAFLCPGQGGGSLAPALLLKERSGPFAAALARCRALLAPRFDLWAGLAEGRTDTTFLQPALVAVAWSAAEMFAAEGVVPDAVIGHSAGELAAWAVAGALSIEGALELAARRGEAMEALAAGGGMGLVLEDAPQLPVGVSIAAYNGPELVVITGPRAQVASVAAQMLPVAYAFHSASVEPSLAAIEEAAAAVERRAPRLPVALNTSGQLSLEAPTPAYFSRQARDPVHFRQGLSALVAHGVKTFVELGGGSLAALARRTVPGTLVTGMEADPLAALHVAGHRVRFRGQRAGGGLPCYPFERMRFAIEPSPSATPPAPSSRRLDFVDRGDE